MWLLGKHWMCIWGFGPMEHHPKLILFSYSWGKWGTEYQSNPTFSPVSRSVILFTSLYWVWTLQAKQRSCTVCSSMSLSTLSPPKVQCRESQISCWDSQTVTFHFWDVGGQEKLRPLWKSYTRGTDGIMFVVDSLDTERMEEAKTELYKIARSSENQGVPVLIIANKQDLRRALSLSQIETMLALNELGPSTRGTCSPLAPSLVTVSKRDSKDFMTWS